MQLRPILFSAPMVRAILDGRKTQTRRVVKPQPVYKDGLGLDWFNRKGEWIGFTGQAVSHGYSTDAYRCPYGQPGDRLWVRETWAVRGLAWGMKPSQAAKIASPAAWRYAADDTTGWQHGWKPSIHMPRAASRITLEITGVRVERLQEIKTGDCWAEGIPASPDVNPWHEYGDLWESINGPGSWNANPWVWVVEFKRVAP